MGESTNGVSNFCDVHVGGDKVEIRPDMVKLENPTKEIHIYGGVRITKAKQDKLGRVYITVE